MNKIKGRFRFNYIINETFINVKFHLGNKRLLCKLRKIAVLFDILITLVCGLKLNFISAVIEFNICIRITRLCDSGRESFLN